MYVLQKIGIIIMPSFTAIEIKVLSRDVITVNSSFLALYCQYTRAFDSPICQEDRGSNCHVTFPWQLAWRLVQHIVCLVIVLHEATFTQMVR